MKRCLLILAVLCCAAPGLAQASGGSMTPDPDWYPLAGANAGLSLQGPGLGALLGIELSAPYLTQDLAWAGFWGDALWNSCTNTGQVGFGPEAGWLFFGVDAGYLLQPGQQTRHGFRARVLFTMALGAVYLGYSEWLTGPGPSRVGSLGFLFKFPITKNL